MTPLDILAELIAACTIVAVSKQFFAYRASQWADEDEPQSGEKP